MDLWYTHMSEDDLRAALGKITALGDGAKAAKGKPSKGGQGRQRTRKPSPARESRPRTRPPSRPRSGRRRPCRRRTPGTACRPCRNSVRWSTVSTGSRASRRWWCRCARSARPTTCPPTRSSTSSASSSASTGRRCRTTAAICWNDSRSSTSPARWSASAASEPAAFIVLLQGRDEQDPLFLQVKEATRSVLEDHLPKSRYHNPGERVVQGQRMMQAASDIYLGWSKGVQADRFFYWRQLRDMKASAVVEAMTPFVLGFYAHAVRLDAGPRARPLRRRGRAGRVPRPRTTASTRPSPTSPGGTPTRTSGTTRSSPRPSPPVGWRRSPGSDGRVRALRPVPDPGPVLFDLFRLLLRSPVRSLSLTVCRHHLTRCGLPAAGEATVSARWHRPSRRVGERTASCRFSVPPGQAGRPEGRPGHQGGRSSTHFGRRRHRLPR